MGNSIRQYWKYLLRCCRIRQDDTLEPQIVVTVKEAAIRGLVLNNNILFFCDYKNHKIMMYSLAAKVLCTLSGHFFGMLDGTLHTATFYYPTSMTMDKNGDLYVAQENCGYLCCW